jgi:hypothetical protein
MSFLMDVIRKTANEGILSRVSPLTRYYMMRLMKEIVIEILRNDQFLFRICAGVSAMIVSVSRTLSVQHRFFSVLILFF